MASEKGIAQTVLVWSVILPQGEVADLKAQAVAEMVLWEVTYGACDP